MNAAPLPENADDDEIESVAEELLGVDFSSNDELAGPIDLDEDDLFGDEFEAELSEPAGAAPPGVIDEGPAEVASAAETGFDDDFGRDVDEEQAAEPQRGAVPQSKSDSYWDALEGWDWDEAGSRAEREEAAREDEQIPVTEESRRGDAQQPLAKKVNEFLEDDEFGAGLLEDASRAPVRGGGERRPPPERRPSPPTAPEQRPEPERQRRTAEEGGRHAGRQGERRPDRGERRRERPEGRKRRDEERRDEERREVREGRETKPAGVEPPTNPEPVLDELSDFGAGLDAGPTATPAEEGVPEHGPRRGRRRRGRGRGRGRDEQQPSETARIPEDDAREPELEPEFDFEIEEAGGDGAAGETGVESVPAEIEPESRYQDVPTWAEAISYLVNPKAKSASRPREGSPGPGEGEPRGSSRRPSGEGERGRRGGSRRGGRGRGRRPPSTSGGSE